MQENKAQVSRTATEHTVAVLTSIADGIAKSALVLMMIYVAADAAGRYFFTFPMPSSYEITENVFMIVLVFFSLAGLQSVNGNVRVALVERFLPRKLRRGLNLLFLFLTLALMSGIAWSLGKVAVQALERGRWLPGEIPIPIGISYAVASLGIGLLCLQIVVQIFKGASATEDETQ